MTSRLLRMGLAVTIGGCTAVSGLDQLEIADDVTAGERDASVIPPRDGAAPDDGSSELPPGPTGWAHRRPVTVVNDTSRALANHAVLVALPPSFGYEKASADGADLRFSRHDNHADDLPYFIESWQPEGESLAWVLVPSVPPGTSSLQMFYGNGNVPAVSRFESVFPKAQRTAGGGAGSFTAAAKIEVDWFELRAGDTLTLPAGAPLEIRAQRIIVAGSVEGDGRGHPGGEVGSLQGQGPGGGAAAADSSASGGGGHGGAGGRGGADPGNTGGAGGAAHGGESDAIVAIGSGGASSNAPAGFRQGGAGGGGVALFGWWTTVSGAIHVNGIAGQGGIGRNAGGGSGGGIVAAACFLDLAGASLQARGGAGGPCASSAHDGGGGGGGGRIKLHARAEGRLIAAASMDVASGAGGAGGGTTAPGIAGVVGSAHVNNESPALSGVVTSLGAETKGR
ncbi:MAG: DUF2341 domain-containing protein [Labilithrix sp.]|nr:DUF2341 domain-containing protein [Labilithrix sp.]